MQEYYSVERKIDYSSRNKRILARDENVKRKEQ